MLLQAKQRSTWHSCGMAAAPLPPASPALFPVAGQQPSEGTEGDEARKAQPTAVWSSPVSFFFPIVGPGGAGAGAGAGQSGRFTGHLLLLCSPRCGVLCPRKAAFFVSQSLCFKVALLLLRPAPRASFSAALSSSLSLSAAAAAAAALCAHAGGQPLLYTAPPLLFLVAALSLSLSLSLLPCCCNPFPSAARMAATGPAALRLALAAGTVAPGVTCGFTARLAADAGPFACSFLRLSLPSQ